MDWSIGLDSRRHDKAEVSAQNPIKLATLPRSNLCTMSLVWWLCRRRGVGSSNRDGVEKTLSFIFRFPFASPLAVASTFCLILMFTPTTSRILASFIFFYFLLLFVLYFMPRSWVLCEKKNIILLFLPQVFFLLFSAFFLVEFLFQSNSPGIL